MGWNGATGKFYWHGNPDITEPYSFYHHGFCSTDACSDFTWNSTVAPPSNAALKACASWDQSTAGCVNGTCQRWWPWPLGMQHMHSEPTPHPLPRHAHAHAHALTTKMSSPSMMVLTFDDVTVCHTMVLRCSASCVMSRDVTHTTITGAYPLQEICSVCTGGAFSGHHERHAMLAWTLVRIIFWVGVVSYTAKIALSNQESARGH